MTYFPTDLASFLEIIKQNKEIAYTLIFTWASSHSLLLTLFAGYASHSGVLQFGTLVAVCWLGSFIGDVFRFWLGRQFGARLLARFPRIQGPIAKAVLLSERHYVWMILLHRYPHGIRGIAAMAYGISALPWSVFLLLNVVASGIWAIALVAAGYALGQVSEKLMNDASSSLGFVMLVLFLGLSWVLSRKADAVLAQTAAAESAARQEEERAAAKRERHERAERQKNRRGKKDRGKHVRKPAE
jgi:membrane protein DedA with SNARE-associated domain